VIKDRIADAMFQQVLLRPEEYGVIATPNSTATTSPDALAAEVGGWAWRRAPTSGTRPRCSRPPRHRAKYANKDLATRLPDLSAP